MVVKNYYKILDLETSRVSIDEIKVAYRQAAKKYHPDLNVGDSLAEEKIKDINEAYKVLSVPSSKRKYDRMWNSKFGKGQKAFTKSQKGAIIDMFLGNVEPSEKETTEKKALPVKGDNIDTKIDVNIYDAFYGLDKQIALKTVDGNLKTYIVKIPKGIQNGEKIRLIGQGKPGENGGKNGDLLIRINVAEDKQYKLVGSDIYTELNISPWEAVLGAKVEVNAIDETIGVYIPQGMETGEEICIENKGYKDNKGGRGKFIIKIKIRNHCGK